MQARFVGLVVVGGLALLALIPSTGVTQYPGPGSSGGPGGSPGGGYSRGMSSMDPGTMFDSMARGETSIPLNDPRFNYFREPLTEWAKRTNFTGTALTKEQFVQFRQSPEVEAARASRMQRFGGYGMTPPGGTPTTATPTTTTATSTTIPFDRPVLIVGGSSPSSSTPVTMQAQSVQQPGGWGGDRGQDRGRESYEFRRRDQNGDGVLSYDEMSNTLKGEKDKWDANRDGVVDQTEYSAYFQGFMARQNDPSNGQGGWGQPGGWGDQGGWGQPGGWGGSYPQQPEQGRNTPSDPDNPMADPGSIRNYRGSETVLYVEIVGSKGSGNVWGTDVYTDDSRIAKAAVHAGIVKEGEKKVVKVTILGSQASFKGSQRNEVTSGDYGPWDRSFKVELASSKTRVFRAGRLPDNIPAWFKECDRDQDGQIGLYEWKATDKVVDDFTTLDRNSDGFVTFQEAQGSTLQPKTNGTTVVTNQGTRPERGSGDSGRGNTPKPSEGGNKSSSDRGFDYLAKGKDTIILADVAVWMGGDRLREWAKKKGITTGTLTREQFREYMDERSGPRR